MVDGTLNRYTAFATDPNGGNPAGVWVGEELPDSETMQRMAAEVGYSETAFIAPANGLERTVRYFSPEAEVSFCGHATIASGVHLGHSSGEGTYRMSTAVGIVPVAVRRQDGRYVASLTSVEPDHELASDRLVAEALSALKWAPGDLTPTIPAARAYAGAWHLVLAAKTRDRLANLEYDFERLKALMLREGLTTLQLVWQEGRDVFHSRNPFPVGGVVEDPATGAAAAAFGGYLRAIQGEDVPDSITIYQGHMMGRPGQLLVTIPEQGGIVVTGAAIPL